MPGSLLDGVAKMYIKKTIINVMDYNPATSPVN
jgi:hypothetical protein